MNPYFDAPDSAELTHMSILGVLHYFLHDPYLERVDL